MLSGRYRQLCSVLCACVKTSPPFLNSKEREGPIPAAPQSLGDLDHSPTPNQYSQTRVGGVGRRRGTMFSQGPRGSPAVRAGEGQMGRRKETAAKGPPSPLFKKETPPPLACIPEGAILFSPIPRK